MTKQELLENYTMEQLADMIVKHQEMTSQIILNENLSNEQMFKNKSAVAYNAELSECKMKIDALENELSCKETTINQIDDILNELFGVTHDIAKPNEFKKILKEKLKGNVGSDGYCEKQKKTNNFYGIYDNSSKDLTKDDILVFLGILTKELVENGIDFKYDMKDEMKVYDITIKDNKTIADFLPGEPIKVADMLINSFFEPKNVDENGMEVIFYKRKFNMSELRQIAEHLLIYCNANERYGE